MMIKAILLFLLITASSCITQKRCENRFGECGRVVNTHTIEYKDTSWIVQGETIYDTLAFWQHDTIRLRDSTGRLTAEIGTIRGTETKWIRITSKPDTLVITKIREVIKEGSVKYVNRDTIPFWVWLIIGGLGLGLLASLFRR